MVAMNVADENVVDPAKFYFVPAHLDLCSFTTINKKKPLIYIKYMSG